MTKAECLSRPVPGRSDYKAAPVLYGGRCGGKEAAASRAIEDAILDSKRVVCLSESCARKGADESTRTVLRRDGLPLNRRSAPHRSGRHRVVPGSATGVEALTGYRLLRRSGGPVPKSG